MERYINIDMFPNEYRKYVTNTHDDFDTAFKKLENLTGFVSLISHIIISIS